MCNHLEVEVEVEVEVINNKRQLRVELGHVVQIHVCRCRKCKSFKISRLNHVYSKTTNVKLYHVTKLLPLLSNYHLLFLQKLRNLMPVRLIRIILSNFTSSTLRHFQLESRVCLCP